MDFINIPNIFFELSIEDKYKFPNYKSKIVLPFLSGYKTLYNENFTLKYNSHDLLLQLRDVLNKIKFMHKNEVFHTDLSSDNIMINKDFDIKFIDLDQMVFGKFISEENILFEDDIKFNEKKILSRIRDKVDILNLYMYYLINGNFKKSIIEDTNVINSNLPDNIKREINAYIVGDIKPSGNYYFSDIVDELIRSGFESNILSLRKGK